MTQKEIKKELNTLREELIGLGEHPNNALNLARKAMNEKYGHSWRTQADTSKRNCRSI